MADTPSAFPDWPRTGDPGQAQCHIFQCADVLEIWLDTIGAARRIRPLFVGIATAAGATVMLLPLGIERINGIRVLGFVDGSVMDYSQPVLFPPAAQLDASAMAQLWPRIRSALPGFDVAILDKMLTEVGGLANPLMHLGPVAMPVSGHVMSLPVGREELEARIPVSKRHLRYMRQLAKDQTVALEVAETPERARLFLDEMIENKTRKFHETRVPGFEIPGKRAFYDEATRRLPNLAPVHLSAVRAGETVVASHWGLVFADRFYFLMTAYAGGEWRKFSPGRILNDELIRWCHANGYRWFDFGIGDEAYKDEYCDVVVPLHAAVIPVTARGKLYLQSGALLARLRALPLWQRLRPYKWVVLRALKRGPSPTGKDGEAA
ncbi:GNAT family N-acetyltransferase [Methylobacterium sp. C25]|uniref:GNAT family N-acetyltransferase n=1 Tax=Methylobacterium sp. C25 TaxID=2721622 RepID=UPI001F458411|nr:GNAT family N-acetyltransferase [Methylobacterium sp. C25]MCE4222153.1 GNAT family N-acetyltransferase [Methylobacterium sp. C25]